MKKHLAVLALTVMTTVGASAANDKGTDFKFGGDLRERFNWTNNTTFASGAGTTDQSVGQRAQFHLSAATSEKVFAYFNVLHTAVWGGSKTIPTANQAYSSAGNPGVPDTTAVNTQNALQLHEAWLWWKLSDSLSLRAGRQTLQLGDGLLVAKNDWMSVPYNVEGLLLHWTADFMDLDFGGAKLNDSGVVSPSTTDSETVLYAAYAKIKGLPEVMKTVDLAVIQVNGDSGTGVAPVLSTIAVPYNLTTLHAHLKGEFSMVDYRADFAFQSGKAKGALGAAGDLAIGGNMYDLQVGYNMPELWKSRFYVDYHSDTGNGTDATKNTTYIPLFYDMHQNLALSEEFGWGNYTDIALGWSLKPNDTYDAGLAYHIMSRSNTNSAPTYVGNGGGSYFNAGGTAAGSYTAAQISAADSSLGGELDLWSKHEYGHGLTVLAQFSYLSLGNYYKPAGASIGSGLQFIMQGTYAF